MAQRHYTDKYRPRGPVRARRGAGRKVAAIAVMGAAAFAAGFFVLWTLGSWIVGGSGEGPGADGGGAAAAAVVSAQTDYTVEPIVDLLAFRDLSYVPVKGVYMTGFSAGNATTVDRLVGLADRTEVNAFVINVKEDGGEITYATEAPMAQSLGTDTEIIEDIDGLLATMAEHNIIPIARIVCFKDGVLPEKRPDLAIMDSRAQGQLWRDNSKARSTYLNPYNHEVWEYLVQVAEDAARKGFREIQFDYVRFPTDGAVEYMEFPGKYCTKDDAIAGFLAYARPRLEKLGVWVSADVFGLVVAHQTSGFGQQLEKMCRNLDIVCPMVYPDLYDSGSYLVDDPNSEPYKIVSGAMKDMAARLPGTGVKGRPWLRDYSWRGVVYGPDEIQAEIRAAAEQGYDEWILWNSSNKYTEDALQPQ
jgi:hypothetical protein